jgi:hypothetical protein
MVSANINIYNKHNCSIIFAAIIFLSQGSLLQEAQDLKNIYEWCLDMGDDKKKARRALITGLVNILDSITLLGNCRQGDRNRLNILNDGEWRRRYILILTV